MLETVTAQPAQRGPRLGLRLSGLAVVALACVGLFLTLGLTGSWAFILERRLHTVATMAVVAIAIAVSTVLFHTVTANQILTPSIMGFDALYLLIQTSSLFVLGVTVANTMDPVGRFGFESALMIGLSLLLYRWLLLDGTRSLNLLILVGVVIGILLRSVSSLLQRVMAPETFIVLQDRFFADFTGADGRLLTVSAVLVGGLCLVVWIKRRSLDVLALGRDTAVGLGLNHRRQTMLVLVIVAVLVSVSTALVGPTTFFGLLVAHLAYQVLGTNKHAWTLPAAALSALVALIGGQVVFERVLGFEGSLSMVVEFLGGIVFILLLLRKGTS